jgi:hypothetical protein
MARSALARAVKLGQLSRQPSNLRLEGLRRSYPSPPVAAMISDALYFLFSRLFGLLAIGFAVS